MKLKLVTLIPLLTISLLSSCKESIKPEDRPYLTYGSNIYVDSINDLKEINSAELLAKTRDENELFLLAVYQGDYSKDCLCWTTFKNTIMNYVNIYYNNVYLFNAQEQTEALLNLKIEKLNRSTPYLYIFNGQKTLAKFSYANKKDQMIFEDATAVTMDKRISKVVNRSHLIYTYSDYIDHLSDKLDSVVLFMRNGCGDCRYVIPNIVIPYINEKRINKNIYLFDMQDVYDNSKKEDASEEEQASYQQLKDTYGLSVEGNATYGYGKGVVPTIQVRRGKQVRSAAVYFNDEVSKKEDGSYYISDSYYTEKRISSLEYLEGKTDFPTILKDMTLNDGVLENGMGGYYLSQNIANVYHKPIFESFLDYYLS